jgi:hypothetical protein
VEEPPSGLQVSPPQRYTTPEAQPERWVQLASRLRVPREYRSTRLELTSLPPRRLLRAMQAERLVSELKAAVWVRVLRPVQPVLAQLAPGVLPLAAASAPQPLEVRV